jgi:hypothetical protein
LQYYPALKEKFSGNSSSSGATSAFLPGMRFGAIGEGDLPAASPSKLNIKADVEKRDGVREAFAVSNSGHAKV